MPNFLYERYAASGSTLPYRAWCQKNKTFQANERKRAMGWYVPNAQHIHYVHLTAIPVPKNTRTIKGMTQEKDRVWVRSLRLAKILVEMDHDHGGSGTYLTFEIRTCKVCGRTLLGREATDYRQRCRWPSHRWYWPWGPSCNAACWPAPHKAEEAIRAGMTMPDRNRKEWTA